MHVYGLTGPEADRASNDADNAIYRRLRRRVHRGCARLRLLDKHAGFELRAMPRFYFHLRNDVDAPDDEGVELASLEGAKAHAVQQARFSFGEAAKELGRVVLSHRIDIEDEQGLVMATVYFRDAVAIEE